MYCVHAQIGAPEHTSEHVKSQKFPGGVPPDPPHTIYISGPQFLYLPWHPPPPPPKK